MITGSHDSARNDRRNSKNKGSRMRFNSAVGILLLSIVGQVLSACGGGGSESGGASTPPPAALPAPTALSYPSAPPLIAGRAMSALSPTVTGTVTAYSVSPALPAGVTLDAASGQISGTPTAAAGQANYTVTASNVSGSTSAVISLTVAPAAPTSLSYPSPQTLVAGQAIAPLNPVVTGSASSYTVLPSLPIGLSLNATTGQISGTPTTATAQAIYVITASNASGSTTFSLSVTINAPPAPTVNLTATPNPAIQATGTLLNWTTTNASNCTASGAWSGAKATSGSASITTPAVGTFTYTLTCQNLVAVTGSTSVVLTVNPAPKFTLGAYSLRSVSGSVPTNAAFLGLKQFPDLDANGWDDLFWTGAYYPFNGNTPIPQEGYVAFNGPGGFAAASPSTFPYAALLDVHARELAIIDFNGDGVRDVFVADHGYDAPPFPGFQNHLFLSQSGTANWVDATANLPQQSDFTHSVCTGDVDGDGKLDIFAGNGGLTDTYVLRGDGAGHFVKDSAILPINSGQALQNAQVGLTACSLVDLDGDSRPELVLGTSYLSRATQVLWNVGGSYANNTIGGGTITALPAPTNFGTDWSIYEIQSTDLNNDGSKDLIVVYNANVLYGGWQIQFLVNQGNHQFTDQTTTYLPDAAAVTSGPVSAGNEKAWISFLLPRDLNGDGRLDYWVETNAQAGSLNDNTPIALIKQANGSFVPVKVGELRAAGATSALFVSMHYVARGPSLPGELVQVFADSNANNQIKMNAQEITFH
jgi:hypothetical protein